MDEQVEYTDGTLDPLEETRRVFDRFPSRFPARFKDTRTDYGTDVYLRNASAEGVRITTKERLYLNDNVTLEIELPDGKSSMTIRGEVVWVKSKNTEMWDVGVRFHKIVLMDMWRPFKHNESSSTA